MPVLHGYSPFHALQSPTVRELLYSYFLGKIYAGPVPVTRASRAASLSMCVPGQ